MGRLSLGMDVQPFLPTLLDRQREAARMAATGRTRKEIAETLNCHPQTITNYGTDPVYVEAKEALHTQRDRQAANITKRVRQGASQGIDYLLRIMAPGTDESSETDHSLKIRVAQDLLDREGSAPKVSRQHKKEESFNLTLTGDDIAEMKRVARKEAGLPEIIDI